MGISKRFASEEYVNEKTSDVVDLTSNQEITGTKTFNKIEVGESVFVNGRQYGVNNVLWTGNSWMDGDNTATLSEAISSQPNGIVLLWSDYSDGAATNKYWNSIFIPKWYVQNIEGQGMSVFLISTPMSNQVATSKYVYIHDTKIVGYNGNNDDVSTPSTSNIKITPQRFVLRYVIGV